MGQGRHLGHGVTSAEGPGAASPSAGGIPLFQLLRHGLKAPDQLPQGYGASQGRRRHEPPPQMLLGVQGQPGDRLRFISLQVTRFSQDVLVFPCGLRRQDVLLQNAGLQRHQNGSRQESLAALRQILFIYCHRAHRPALAGPCAPATGRESRPQQRSRPRPTGPRSCRSAASWRRRMATLPPSLVPKLPKQYPPDPSCSGHAVLRISPSGDRIPWGQGGNLIR